jgi:hypothetical protein
MSSEERDLLYKTLNDCTAMLTGSVDTGQSYIYATMDRHRYNQLLQAITEAKKLIIRANSRDG